MKGNVQPSVRKKIEPHYPPAARSKHSEGTVKLTAVINASGPIEQVEFMSGPLVFFPASKEAVRQWQFRPAQIAGERWLWWPISK